MTLALRLISVFTAKCLPKLTLKHHQRPFQRKQIAKPDLRWEQIQLGLAENKGMYQDFCVEVKLDLQARFRCTQNCKKKKFGQLKKFEQSRFVF